MELLELIWKLIGATFVIAVFVKAWSEWHKVWAILSFLWLVAILYCWTHWYEMKNYFLYFLWAYWLLFVISFTLISFEIV